MLRGRCPVVALGRHRPPAVLEGVEWRDAPDLQEESAHWLNVLSGIDVIVHLAAIAHLTGPVDPRRESLIWRVNAIGPQTIANACIAAGVSRLVFLSSIKAVAERSTSGISVDACPAPGDAYGRAKHAAEEALLRIGCESSLDVAIARCPLIYSRTAQGNLKALARIIRLPIPLPFGSIRNRRSLVALNTLCSALAHLALARTPQSGIYHIADRAPYSTADIVRLVAKINGLEARVFPCPEPLVRAAVAMIGGASAVDRLLGSLELETADTFARMGWWPPDEPSSS